MVVSQPLVGRHLKRQRSVDELELEREPKREKVEVDLDTTSEQQQEEEAAAVQDDSEWVGPYGL